jgi:hypothetical protein
MERRQLSWQRGEQLTNAITVLTLHATHRPDDSPRVRAVFEQLLEVVHRAETDMAVFDLT